MRCPEKNHKLISWIIDGIEYRFKEWVTKDEAEEAVQNESIIVVRSKGNPYIQRAIIN